MEKIKEILYEKFYSSSLSEEELEDALSIIENNKNNKRIKLAFENLYLYSGISFLLSSILYFVAYNIKFTNDITRILLMYLVTFIPLSLFFVKLKEDYKKIALFSLCFLIGVLFAVFGQIYQTGADSYFLFLFWTMAITPMVIISRFSPLFILHYILIVTTIVLFGIQNKNSILVSVLSTLVPITFYYFFYKIREKLGINKWYFSFLVNFTFMFYTIYLPIIGIIYFGKYEFFISLILYCFVLIYFQYSKKGLAITNYTKITSLIPCFLVIPIFFSNLVNGFDSLVFILFQILLGYIGLIKRISYLRGEMQNEYND